MKKILALVLAAAMMLSMAACGNSEPTPTGTTAPGETTAPKETTKGDSTDPTKSEEQTKLYGRKSYTGDDQAAASAVNTVVATMGDAKLTNGMLQVYYWLDFYSFINNYGGYLSMFGLDYTKPLDEQDCPDTDGTWQHYFLESALNTWKNYQALALCAEAENVPMEPELQKQLDELEKTMLDSAKENKYDSIEAMLRDDAGPGCDFASYKQYMTVYHRGYSYFNAKYAEIEVTDAMIEEYFGKNEKTLKEDGITKDSGNNHDVRHILIEITGGTKDADGNVTYSDADWAACQTKAQQLLDQWLQGDATEESFAALAVEHSADGGSYADGGLYTDLNKDTNFVEEFKNWYLEEGRAKGDYGLIKTDYGYHIMYYSGAEAQWIRTCRSAIMDEMTTKLVTEAVEKFTMDVNYDAIVIGNAKLDKE